MKRLLPFAILALTLSACSEPSPVTHTKPDAPTAKRVPMEWYAYSEGDDENGIPQNRLVLKTAGEDRQELFVAECAGTTQVADIPDLSDSVSYIRCWWAGGGEDFAVFIGDAEQATIRHRTVDEESGYSDWEDLKTL